MRILLDQGTPRLAAVLLRESGFDVVHTSEIGLAMAEDLQVLAHAENDERLIVTLDAGFHAHLALSGAKEPSLIRIRLEGLKSKAFVDLLLKVISQCEPDL